MVKLDVSSLRYLAKDDFRVLTAVEMGMRNHELVPRALVYSISGIQNGSVSKILMNLTQNKLLSYERGKRYDGYRLTYMGYDYLALNVLRNRGVVDSVGHQIGVGKESDVYVAASNDNSDDESKKFAIKFHRLGRTCFRKVSEKRDYQRKNQNHKNVSWIYLSRLAAMREFAFMKLLYEQKLLPVPEPIDMNRHCIVMELIDGVILNNISAEDFKENPEAIKNLYDKLMAIIIRLTNEFGVVHGDFNEFNILIKLDGTFDPVLIDFPQMISVNHELAEQYFERDVNCIVDFFAKRFHYESDTIPIFEPPVQSTQENQINDLRNLADALEDEEEIMKYSEQRKKHLQQQESEEKCQDACPFKDGKSELLSRFLESLPNDDEAASIFNNSKTDEEPNNPEYANLPDLINNVNLSEGTERNNNNNNNRTDEKPSVNVENSVNNSTDVLPNRILNEAFDQSSHNSDVYSTATTFSVMEIKNRLIREHRKQEIKQRMRINPKKTIKGDANAMRRKKKDDQKLANEDLKSFRNDGGGFW